MAELSIKVGIANRIYPLKINIEEEEAIRKAVKLINDKLKEYEENYSVKDKQDLLAMCALQFATESAKNDQKIVIDDNSLEDQLAAIEALLKTPLQENAVL
jgi:cell division protein ZapA